MALSAQHERIFAEPRFYDIAFGYRDFAAECDFLYDTAALHLGRPPASVLELGAGPAGHAIELARRGLAAQALDRAPSMVRYGLEKAATAGVALAYHTGDMTDFALPRPVDLALLLLGSASCLLTQDDFVACLDRTAAALNPKGLLVIELPHPRTLFGGLDATDEAWEVVRDGTRVRVKWGAAGDRFDPVTQIAEITTTLTVWEGGRKRILRDRALQRHYTAPELVALTRISGALSPVAWHGALDRDVAFDDPDAAWRMVAVLQKPDGTG